MISSIFLCLLLPFSPAISAKAEPANPWIKVGEEVKKSVAKNEIKDFLFEVYNSKHEKVFSFGSGTINREEDIPVLSSAKWVSSAVIQALVDQKRLSLDAPLSSYVKQPNGKELNGPLREVTMRQLLSFTSGIEQRTASGEHVGSECYQNRKVLFADCVQTVMNEAPIEFVPGKKFVYGNNHFVIAAWAAVQVAGESWQKTFEKNLVGPLGLSSKPAYYAKPRTKNGLENPGLAHGLRISFDDYLKFMRMIYDHGTFEGKKILSKESVIAIETNHWRPGIEQGFSPAELAGVRAQYGLGAWLECRNPDCSRKHISSVGLAGFYPWIDRESGYYAIVGAYSADSSDGVMPWKDAWKLAQRLKPLIEEALPSP